MFFFLPAANHWFHCPPQVLSPFLQLGLLFSAVFIWLPCIWRSGKRVNFRLGRLSWAQQLYSSISIYIFKHHPAMPNQWQWFVLGIHASLIKKKKENLSPLLPFIFTSCHFSTQSNPVPVSTMLLSEVSNDLHASFCSFLICPHDIWYCCSLTYLWDSALHFWDTMLWIFFLLLHRSFFSTPKCQGSSGFHL